MEALTTAASALDVGIVENELAAKLLLLKVHLSAEQRELRFAVDEDLDAVLLYDFVELLLLLGVVERVGEPVASPLLHADSETDGLLVLGHQIFAALNGSRRESNGSAACGS